MSLTPALFLLKNRNAQMHDDITKILLNKKFSLHSEKVLQQELNKELSGWAVGLQREYRLDGKNIIDFFVDGVGIEVKINGNRKDIFKQCKRYCDFFEVKSLILVTNRAIGFPSEINNKPCNVINLGIGWL